MLPSLVVSITDTGGLDWWRKKCYIFTFPALSVEEALCSEITPSFSIVCTPWFPWQQALLTDQHIPHATWQEAHWLELPAQNFGCVVHLELSNFRSHHFIFWSPHLQQPSDSDCTVICSSYILLIWQFNKLMVCIQRSGGVNDDCIIIYLYWPQK